MGNPSNLQYSSAFNYQKIITEGSQNVSIPASVTSTTVLASIPTDVEDITTFRGFVEYNELVEEVSYTSNIGLTGATLYLYSDGPLLNLAIDSSTSAYEIIFYWRVYLDSQS